MLNSNNASKDFLNSRCLKTNIREELGDVLLHVIFQSQIASEKSDFDINDVIDDINEKLIDRHPHVFEKSTLLADKLSNELWEEQKYKKKGRKSRLDGVPKILPSIISSQRIQAKASSAGFDWEDVSQVWEKLDEEETTSLSLNRLSL